MTIEEKIKKLINKIKKIFFKPRYSPNYRIMSENLDSQIIDLRERLIYPKVVFEECDLNNDMKQIALHLIPYNTESQIVICRTYCNWEPIQVIERLQEDMISELGVLYIKKGLGYWANKLQEEKRKKEKWEIV